MDFLKLFETVVVASVPQDARVHRPTVSFGDPGTSKGNHGDAKGKKSEATPSNESQTAAVAHPIESEVRAVSWYRYRRPHTVCPNRSTFF